MKLIVETLATADDCRKQANQTKHPGQRAFYRNLEKGLLEIARLKQWLEDKTTEARLIMRAQARASADEVITARHRREPPMVR